MLLTFQFLFIFERNVISESHIIPQPGASIDVVITNMSTLTDMIGRDKRTKEKKGQFERKKTAYS